MPRVGPGTGWERHRSDLGQNGAVNGRIWDRTELSTVGSGSEPGVSRVGSGSERERHWSDLGRSGNASGRIRVISGMSRVGSGPEWESHGSDIGHNGSDTDRIWIRTGMSPTGPGSERGCHGLDLGQNGGKNQHTPVGKNQAPNLTFPMTLYSSGSVKNQHIPGEKTQCQISHCQLPCDENQLPCENVKLTFLARGRPKNVKLTSLRTYVCTHVNLKIRGFFLLFPRLLCSILFIGVPPARVRLNHMPGAEGRLLHSNGPKASFWASRDTRSGIPLPGTQMFCFAQKTIFSENIPTSQKARDRDPAARGGGSGRADAPPARRGGG